MKKNLLTLMILSVTANLSTVAYGQELPEKNKSITENPTEKQSVKEKSSTLEAVTVVGGFAPKSIADTTSSIYYIDNEEIERGAASGKTVSEIIAASVPSLNVSTEARTNYAQNMRGSRVLVMIDGISMNSSRLVSRQFDSISPFNIEHIEILSGSTSVYGGNATGGIINIVTKKGKDEGLHGTTSIGIKSGFQDGDDLDYVFSQSLRGGNDTVQGRLGVNFNQTQKFFDGSGEAFIPDITQGSLQHNRTVDILAGVSVQPTETQNIDASVQYYHSKQDRPDSYDFGPKLAGLSGVPAHQKLITVSDGFESDRQAETTRKQINLNYSNDEFFGGQSFIGQFSHRQEELNFMPYPKPTGMKKMPVAFSASQQSTDVTTLRLALVKDIEPVKVTYGISASKEDFDANQMLFDPMTAVKSQGLVNKKAGIIGRYPDISIKNVSAFTDVEYQVDDKLALGAGYRFEYLQNDIGDFVGANQQAAIALGAGRSADVIKGGSNDYKMNLFNLGARYDLADNQQIWTQFSQGFELPDPAKYYGVGQYEINPKTGNWDLKKSVNANENILDGIKNNSLELGWRIDNGALNLQTSAYYSVSDKTVLANSKTLNVSVVDNERRTFGIEGRANYAVNDNWDIGGQFHFSRTQEKDDNGKWIKPIMTPHGKQELRSQPANPNKLGAYVQYHNNDWRTRLSAISMLDSSDGANNKFDGYTLFDLDASYKLGGGDYGTLNFAVNNLFDKKYTTIWGQQASIIYSTKYTPAKMFKYQGRGRTFMLNYQYDF